MASTGPDAELKARHRTMWASGNYPSMVETFLLPLGPRLVEASSHFKERYGPTIAAQRNGRQTGQEAEFEEALDRFSEEWNLGTVERARFEMEYLLAVGERV